MEPREQHTLMVAAFGLAAIALSGAIFVDYVPWPLGGGVCVLSAGAGAWLQRRAKQANVKPAVQKVESGLRIVEKELPAKPKLRHGLRLTISTEVAVALGLRVVSDVPIPEVEPLAQIGRGACARQGTPPAVRESRQAWLFVVHNSPGQRELFLRLDLFAAQPFKVERVEQIRPGGKVALPEWKELDLGLHGDEEAPAETPPPAPGAAASEPASAAGDPAGPAGSPPPPAAAEPAS